MWTWTWGALQSLVQSELYHNAKKDFPQDIIIIIIVIRQVRLTLQSIRKGHHRCRAKQLNGREKKKWFLRTKLRTVFQS